MCFNLKWDHSIKKTFSSSCISRILCSMCLLLMELVLILYFLSLFLLLFLIQRYIFCWCFVNYSFISSKSFQDKFSQTLHIIGNIICWYFSYPFYSYYFVLMCCLTMVISACGIKVYGTGERHFYLIPAFRDLSFHAWFWTLYTFIDDA